MIALTLAEVAALTGGRLVGPPAGPEVDPRTAVTGEVRVDSRRCGPGDLFVALPGERADGHDFAAVAVAAGAVAVLAARPCGVPAVLVPDPQAALGRLARGVIDRLPGLTVIGVTGSSGKTSTKDLLAVVLAAAGPTIAPQGSFNNEIGMPLTVLRADPGSRFLVAEMGARGIGHIAYLCGIAPPRISVVLNVGSAHVAEFGDRDTIARAKGEIVEALPAAGVAVLNVDDPRVAAMRSRTAARVVTTGRDPSADVRAVDVTLDPAARAAFRLVTAAGSAHVRLALHGEHHVANALAAAAVGLEAGLDVATVAAALSAAAPASRWRMEVRERADGAVVVNDAYNANPESVAAALRATASMVAGRSGRGWAVLGEMLELGETSAAAHRDAGRLAAELGLGVVAVGPGAAPVAEGARRAGPVPVPVPVPVLECTGPDAAVAALGELIGTRDVVLVKASRGIGLERVAEALLAPAPGSAPGPAPAPGSAGGPHLGSVHAGGTSTAPPPAGAVREAQR